MGLNDTNAVLDRTCPQFDNQNFLTDLVTALDHVGIYDGGVLNDVVLESLPGRCYPLQRFGPRGFHRRERLISRRFDLWREALMLNEIDICD